MPPNIEAQCFTHIVFIINELSISAARVTGRIESHFVSTHGIIRFRALAVVRALVYPISGVQWMHPIERYSAVIVLFGEKVYYNDIFLR